MEHESAGRVKVLDNLPGEKEMYSRKSSRDGDWQTGWGLYIKNRLTKKNISGPFPVMSRGNMSEGGGENPNIRRPNREELSSRRKRERISREDRRDKGSRRQKREDQSASCPIKEGQKRRK